MKLLQRTGVKPTVDMAVRLGLRNYTIPGSSGFGDKSIATYVKEGNLGSFTLGPFPVNGSELSNVAATLASGGVWCPPIPSRRSRRSSATATATSSSAPTGARSGPGPGRGAQSASRSSTAVWPTRWPIC